MTFANSNAHTASNNGTATAGTSARHAPFVSIIIPTYNEAWHLAECLQSLCEQDYANYEIILVDNGSTDNTRAECSKFPRVKYVYYDSFQSSYAARNEGRRNATGDVLLFFDADQTARPGMISSLMHEYQPAEGVEVVAGRLDDDPRVPLVLTRYFAYGTLAGDLSAGYIATAVVAISGRLFDQLGGFVPELLSHGDKEFFSRAVQHTTARQTETISGYHYWARSVTELYKREERFLFGKCLKATHEGRPPIGVSASLWNLAKTTLIKSCVAATVPLRHAKRDWPLTLQAQWVGVAVAYHRLLGVLKFHRGHVAAGDCPVPKTVV